MTLKESAARCGLAMMWGLLLTGCMSVRPSPDPYTFLRNDEGLSQHLPVVYSPGSVSNPNRLNLLITNPTSGRMEFHRSARVRLSEKGDKPFRLPAGVYPFLLKEENEDRTPVFCGAMMVYNLDKTVSLATLGRTAETILFNPELVAKASKGVLARYTMEFDKKNVLTYWLGNRTTLYGGGEPTVEVDFSGTPGITELTINGSTYADFACELPVYRNEKNSYGGIDAVPIEYRIELTCGGKEFHGYLQKLKDNDFTAFVRIPCTISKELLEAASQGTVSKFTVMSQGEKPEAVAEIVISGK